MPVSRATRLKSDLELLLMQRLHEITERLLRRFAACQHNPLDCGCCCSCKGRDCRAAGFHKAHVGAQRLADGIDTLVLIAAPSLLCVAKRTADGTAVQSDEDHRHSGERALALHGWINVI